MALASAYTVAVNHIPDLFTKIRDGQAPDQFTQQLLKDWGFASSNDRSLIPILKALGFLSPEGKPTSAYHEYRDHSRSKAVMAHALKAAYGDVFLIKEHPTEADKEAVRGKFKSFHNVSDHVATLMMRTFYALLQLADLKASTQKGADKHKTKDADEPPLIKQTEQIDDGGTPRLRGTGLHYNIQIHLPSTKDVEVYNAIFKSLREHLLDE